ncbi:MAG: zinc ABC transporter substrate-binding protein [Marivibrio sp.]|uniref:zinc ABC transporter substrate-binding protein n=1 Tax=Marivibrio sp. TaxID=2039719 RepID=UPI0032EC8401
MPIRRPAAALALSTALAAAAFAAHPARADAPKVVASIKPVHALAAQVMDGVGAPTLLVEGAASPHAFSLRPSQAQALQGADVVFWVGPDLEQFLVEARETLAADARSAPLMQAAGVETLTFRADPAFEPHSHDDEHGHGDHGHDDHGHDEHGRDHGHDHDHDHAKAEEHDHGHDDHGHDDHGHDDHGHDDHGHDDHGHDHAHGGVDAHIWLDPMNAKAMLAAMAETLAAADPANAARYRANADAAAGEIDALSADLAERLAPVRERPYIVFHDAYQYFERRFGLSAIGAVTVSPERAPGAARVQAIRDRIQETGAVCVFSEPQFEPRIVEVVTEGTGAATGVLDPLGATLEPGPGLYAALMTDLADSALDCLSPRS